MKDIVGSECRELLSLIAHELRSPAAVVAGYLRLLVKNPSDSLSEADRRMIGEANRSCGRILTMVQELADLAALQDGDPLRSKSPVQLFDLFNEVVRAAPADPGPIAFSWPEHDRTATVMGDASRLKQATAALVAAARRERGPEQLEARGFVHRTLDSGRAVLALGSPENVAALAASAGSEAPFDVWRGGMGMSVPIACRIVEVHGGSVWSLPDAPRAACAFALPLAT